MSEKNRSTSHRFFSFLKTRLGRILIFATLGVSTAIGCAWSFITDHSVRFNDMRTGRGFYRLPPLPIAIDPITGKERSQREVESYEDYDDGSYEAEQEALAKPETVWAKAMIAKDANDLVGLGRELREYLAMTEYYGADKNRNSAVDILDALEELKHGSGKQDVMAYIAARLDHLDHFPAIGNEIPNNVADRNLKDNWEYLRAAILYDSDKKDEAFVAFQAHVSHFPHSEKNEAAMYMIGRIKLEQSYSFEEQTCGIEGETDWAKDTKAEDPQKCRDQAWQEAIDQFKQIICKYPNGRYSLDARGWLAFLYKRGSKRAEALAEYYRLLGQTKNIAWRLEAKKSLQIIGHEYDDATLDRLESLISDEPETALAYAYHRIYNHATDFTYDEFNEWCCDGEDEWSQKNEEEKRVKKVKDEGRHELERIAKFATAMVKRYGNSRVGGDFMLRIAEAQLELENFNDAHALADRSLALGVKEDLRAQALWVKGSSEHHQKKLVAAKSTFLQLIKEFPDNKLTEGAQRLLAMTAEDQDDLELALDMYFQLNYKYDIAYFVDILMPTDRLAKYVAARKGSENHHELLYALGVRYMRDRRWSEARETLKQVLTKTVGAPEYSWDSKPVEFNKDPDRWENRNDGIIQTQWVMRDIQTVNDLERLEKAVADAVDDETKAEAMYQLASYQFDSDELLFYNPAAWSGMRHDLLYEFNYGNHWRLPGESQGIFEYSKSHETLARAIPIYLDIVDRYPNTKAAKDALYSAVIAHEKLGDLNPYWRDMYANGFFAGQKLVKNSDIRRMFPKFRWPTSRLGWEASTRTVNGGSPYPPPPKPLPKISRADRAKMKLEKWFAEYKPTLEKGFSTVKEKVSNVSSTATDNLLSYLYLVFSGLMGAIVWANRRELYNGPIKKGYAYSRIGYRYFIEQYAGQIGGWISSKRSLIYFGKLSNEDDKGKVETAGGDRDS